MRRQGGPGVGGGVDAVKLAQVDWRFAPERQDTGVVPLASFDVTDLGAE